MGQEFREYEDPHPTLSQRERAKKERGKDKSAFEIVEVGFADGGNFTGRHEAAQLVKQSGNAAGSAGCTIKEPTVRCSRLGQNLIGGS